mmetsp:Transcript_7422/g.17898  ORF Transcript_7422/g.17898 Transcript_7422/m.17898 type:complete len:133 (-) Transcript_7422:123-521(-)
MCLDAPGLAGTKADAGDFDGAEGGGKGVQVFPNLGHDALLVVPPEVRSAPDSAAHLAAFVRGAPEADQQALFKALGEAIHTEAGPTASLQKGSNETALWVNTEGSGVPFLHVRLDTRPKYYHHAAYKAERPE